MSASEESFKEQLAKLLNPGNTDTTFECPVELEFYSEDPKDTIFDTVPIITTTGQTLSKKAVGQYDSHPLSPNQKLTEDDKHTPNVLLQQIFACLLATLKKLSKEPNLTFETLVDRAAAEWEQLLKDPISKQRLQAEQGIVVFIGTDGQTFNQSTLDDPEYKQDVEQYLARFGLTLATARQKGIVRNLAVQDLVSKISTILSHQSKPSLEKAEALFNHGNYQQALEMYTLLMIQLYEQPNLDPAISNFLSATYFHQIGKCHALLSKFQEAIAFYEMAQDPLSQELFSEIPCSNPDIIIRYLQIFGSLEHAQRTQGYKGAEEAFGEAQVACDRVLNIMKRLPPELLQHNSAIQFELATLYEGQLWALKKINSSDEDVKLVLADLKKTCLGQFDDLTRKGEAENCQDPYVLLKRAQYYTYLASVNKEQESHYTDRSAAFCRRILLGNRMQELPVNLQQKVRIQYGIALINQIKHQKIPLGMTLAERYGQNAPLQAAAREAEHIFMSVLHQDPNQRTAILNQAMALFWLGDFEKAARLCNQRLRVAPNDVPIKLNLINALLRQFMMPELDWFKRQALLNEVKGLLDSIQSPPKAGEEKQLYEFLLKSYSERRYSMALDSGVNAITPSIAPTLSLSMSTGVFQTPAGELLPQEKNFRIQELGITAEQFNQNYKGQYKIEPAPIALSTRNNFLIKDKMNQTVGILSLQSNVLTESSLSKSHYHFFETLLASQFSAQKFTNTR